MATTAEMRAWLRANTDEDVPERGRLLPRLITLYKTANPEDMWTARPPVVDDPDWDLDGDGDMAGAEDLEPSVPMQPERAPRTQRAARAERRSAPVGQRAGRILGTLTGTKPKTDAKGKPKKAPPRMSLDKFISRAYSSLGRMVKPLSTPMSNCLQAQSAMAGVIFEDIARGTIMDRLLQPAARAEDKLDKGFALVAPPLVVLAIEQTSMAVQTGRLNEAQAMVRMAVLQPVLRESLRIGLEVAESYGDVLVRRIQENAKRDAEVDELIAMIFAPPEGAPSPEPQMAGAAA